MADRVFCIDLGSGFTKVALRRGRWVNSDLIADPRLSKLDELKMCVSSTVAVDYSTAPPTAIFGDAALDRRPGPTLRVFTNWKKDLFAEAARAAPPVPVAPPSAAPRTPSRLETLIRSTDFLQLAAKHGVSSVEVAALTRLFATAAAVLAPPPSEPTAPLTPADSNPFKVAVLFFRHLRKTVLEVCKAKNTPPNPETIPARLCVPAFADERELPAHSGCRWLAEAMGRAEWPLVEHRPVVSEPYSNALGVLTQGSNCTRAKDMFRDGLLITSLAKPKDHPEYRAVVIDVGAFTVDFATLTYDTGGKDRSLDELEFQQRALSLPLGISALDEAVLGVLPHRQVEYLRRRAPAIEWMDFRPRLYAERQPFPTEEVGEIGGGTDAKRVEAALGGYTDQLTQKTTEFLKDVPDVPFKELILTGGGSALPAVQDALIRGAEANREKFRKVHLPAVRVFGKSKQSSPQQVITTLDPKLNRGGSALGGSSVYFDMDREPYPMPK